MAVGVLGYGSQLLCHPTKDTQKKDLSWSCSIGPAFQKKASNCSLALQPQMSWSCVAASSALLHIKYSKEKERHLAHSSEEFLQ